MVLLSEACMNLCDAFSAGENDPFTIEAWACLDAANAAVVPPVAVAQGAAALGALRW